jgi:hypothetical protein
MSTFAKLTIAMAVVVATGCATAEQKAPTVNVTGNWVGEWVCSKQTDGAGVVMMKLTQSGSDVSGSAHVTNASINRTTSGLTGVVSGDQFTIPSYRDLSGSLTVTGDKMAGSMIGPLCGGKVSLTREAWQGKGERSRLTTRSATVQSIDQANRMVTLKGQEGSLLTLQVDERVQNLPLVAVGDIVTVAYYESWALKLNEAPGATTTVTQRAAPGQMPGGYTARRTNIKATVVAMDPGKPSVTFRGPSGNPVEIDVSDDPRVLSQLKVGETYDVSYTESLAVAVTKGPGG